MSIVKSRIRTRNYKGKLVMFDENLSSVQICGVGPMNQLHAINNENAPFVVRLFIKRCSA